MQKFKFLTLAIITMLSVNLAWGADKTITLTYSNFSLTTTYSKKTATVSGISFTVDQGYKGDNNVIQMNSSKGSGTLYNTTAIEGLKSITVNVSKGSNTYTIYTGTGAQPTTSAGTGSSTSTINVKNSGDTYFKLSVSGASYFSSIVITYDDEAGGGGETSATYVKATSLSDLCVGAKVIIAASGSNVAMSEEQKTNNRGQYAITKNGNNATWTMGTTDVEELTLGITTGGKYTFKTKDNKYLYASSSSSNELKSQSTNNANGEWTISFSNGTPSITATGTNSRNVMQYNQSSSLFSCYSSASQKALAIYVKDGDCSGCTTISPTLSYTATATIGQVLNPTLDKKGSSGTVTYSIKSGGSYASINASTGVLTCSATGTVTVQATIAAAGAYCEGTATSNTITISAPSYTVTAQSNNTELGTVSGTTTITASPKECVGYANPAYTVAPAGKATVAQSSNTFTVSNVTADVTITINFAALAKDTYEDHLHGNATIEKCGSYTAPSLDDATKATTGDCDVVHYHFAGWVTSTISTGTPGAPAGMVTAGTAMNANGTAYIAVWAKEQ